MKIMIITDMEGVAGLLNFEDWAVPAGRYYEKGKRLLTLEVNAAAEGLFTEGAKEIVVVDGHGHGGIDPELLDQRLLLLRGNYKKPWPFGLDTSFSALVFVGQHAKSGTPYSHITHTGWFNLVDLTINNISIGEYGQLAFCAMELGIPTILACGEEALTREAEALTPGVVTAWGKKGILPDGLEELNTESYMGAKLSAIHRSPGLGRKLIKEAAAKALQKLKQNQNAFSYPELKPPYTRIVKIRKTEDNPATQFKTEHPKSIIELLNINYNS